MPSQYALCNYMYICVYMCIYNIRTCTVYAFSFDLYICFVCLSACVLQSQCRAVLTDNRKKRQREVVETSCFIPRNHGPVVRVELLSCNATFHPPNSDDFFCTVYSAADRRPAAKVGLFSKIGTYTTGEFNLLLLIDVASHGCLPSQRKVSAIPQETSTSFCRGI